MKGWIEFPRRDGKNSIIVRAALIRSFMASKVDEDCTVIDCGTAEAKIVTTMPIQEIKDRIESAEAGLDYEGE